MGLSMMSAIPRSPQTAPTWHGSTASGAGSDTLWDGGDGRYMVEWTTEGAESAWAGATSNVGDVTVQSDLALREHV